MPEQSDYERFTMEQIEAFVEEVIDANAVWPDPLPSQRDAVMDVVREAMAQAWDEGAQKRAQYDPACSVRDLNPYWPAVTTRSGGRR